MVGRRKLPPGNLKPYRDRTSGAKPLPACRPILARHDGRVIKRVLGLVVVALVALVGCAEGSTTDPSAEAGATRTDSAPAPTRPFDYEVTETTLVDTSRPTPEGSETSGADSRTLVTTIYLPDAPGPRPWIVFAHGLSGHPDKFRSLLTTWAEAGYVVAAPAFPSTNAEVPGSEKNAADGFEQPADVRFVIDELFRLGDDPSSPLHGRLDPDRLGSPACRSAGRRPTASCSASAAPTRGSRPPPSTPAPSWRCRVRSTSTGTCRC